MLVARLVLLSLLLGPFILVKGCTVRLVDWMNAPLPYTEVQRLSDSKGEIDAVLIRRHAHSTVSDPFELFLVPRDEDWDDSVEPVFRADHAYSTNISWLDERSILVQSSGARYFVKSEVCKTARGARIRVMYR